MVVVPDVTDALAARLQTINGLTSSRLWRDTIETPGVLIFPPSLTQDTLDGVYTLTYRLLVIVNISQGLGEAARALEYYMSTTGDTSILLALEGDLTLDGTATDVDVGAMRWTGDRAGFIAIGGAEYWGSYIENLQVYVCD